MPTCGEQYKHIATVALRDHEGLGLFSYGWIAGQAEKVALGACLACMIRPGDDWRSVVIKTAEEIGATYGLAWELLSYDGHLEVWLLQPTPEAWGMINTLCAMLHDPMAAWREAQWAEWHRVRAALCGVSEAQCDPQYHLRNTYNLRCEPCEPSTTETVIHATR